MVVIRNKLSGALAGGPRQFSELRDKIILEAENFDGAKELESRLNQFGLSSKRLDNSPVIVAEPRDQIEDALTSIADTAGSGENIEKAVQQIREARMNGEAVVEAQLEIEQATIELFQQVSRLEQVVKSEFAYTFSDYGPENLRLSPIEMDTVFTGESGKSPNLKDLGDKLGVTDAHGDERGENAIVAVFDTGFAEDLISEERLVETWSGPDVDTPFASAEGHGTMCAGAAAANSDEGVPFDGAAPDAGVILVRITDDEGSIRSDYITQAWDWLMGLDLDRPIVTNHSYGTPLCSGRPRSSFCNTPSADVVRKANAQPNIISCYAAGNEAMRCGHRLSGLTNGITGYNSLDDVITVGALRFDLNDAQNYSSHGRGDCAPISDPKPNVSCALPRFTYYGSENGWEVKDMGSGYKGSSGGTSHASPFTAGMLALVQSKAMKKYGEPLQKEEVKTLLRENSDPPRRTQVNSFGLLIGREGYDARFGYGQPDIISMLQSV